MLSNEMISDFAQKFQNPFDSWELDKAKRSRLKAQVEEMGLLQQMQNCLWLTCARYLYRFKETAQDVNMGFVTDAITSRKAVEQNTHDGGREGFYKANKHLFGGKLNTSRGSLEKCDRLLEDLGIIRKHHNGHGLVAHIEVNVRSAILLIEALHPQWDEIPQMFRWLKSFCDKALQRLFNRKDWERGEHVPSEELEERIEQYDEEYPLQAIAPESLPWLLAKSFYRFCVRKTKEYAERFWVDFGVEDYWLGFGDSCDKTNVCA